MPIFKRRSNPLLAWYLSGSGDIPAGYTRLLDTPEVSACINRISAIISSGTIYLLQNTKDGDKRVKNGLSRFVDIDPWPGHGTRQSWMTWIVRTLLGEGDGNAYVFPVYSGNRFQALVPMPGAVSIPSQNGDDYLVEWRGRTLDPNNVLHFRLFADELSPWKGKGYRVQAEDVAQSLKQTDQLKRSLSSPKYKPPLVVAVETDSDLSDDGERERLRSRYLEETQDGKPWIIPANLMKMEQVKPLTLTDLAVKDTVELDKKTVASIFGVPPFLLGLGAFNRDEYNSFIKNVVLPICVGIEQELTLKLLLNEELYFQFNRRRLFDYDLKDLVKIDLGMSDRGYVDGDEVREDAYRDPRGLKELRVLENYIPADMVGDQKKLIQKEGKDDG